MQQGLNSLIQIISADSPPNTHIAKLDDWFSDAAGVIDLNLAFCCPCCQFPQKFLLRLM